MSYDYIDGIAVSVTEELVVEAGGHLIDANTTEVDRERIISDMVLDAIKEAKEKVIDEAVIDRLNQEEYELCQRYTAQAVIVGWKWAETADFDDINTLVRRRIQDDSDPFFLLSHTLAMIGEDLRDLAFGNKFNDYEIANYASDIADGFADGVRAFVEVAQKQGAFQNTTLD